MMLSKVSTRVVRGIPAVSRLFRPSVMMRAGNPALVSSIGNMYIQQRSFGRLSDFKQSFNEELGKIKQQQASEKAATETGAADAENAEKVTDGIENADAKLSSSTDKVKAKMDESKQKLKEGFDESTQKMKEGLGDVSKEAKEQLKKGTKKVSSFFGEFTGELKNQLKSKPSTSTPSAAKKTVKAKKAKTVKKTVPKVDVVAAAATTESNSTEAAEAPSSATSDAKTAVKLESVEELEDVEEEDEELDPMSDEALGITAEMSEDEADAVRKEAMHKKIKEENYTKKKVRLADTVSHSWERTKVKLRSITWEKIKYFLRDGWNDIRGSNQKPHRVLLNEEEVEAQRQEILKSKEEAEKLKEEHEKTGTPLKTDLMNVDNSNNIWAQVTDLLKDAPLIESLLQMGRKVKESKVGETVTYATEDFREKWETSQHPLVYKLSAVYDELFSESDTARAIKEVRRTDPTFLEDALRDEMKRSIVPAMLEAWVNADTKKLKIVMSDHAYAQVYSVIKMQQAEGLQMDKNVLDIKDVSLQSAHIMEKQNPAFLYLVTVQMINCIRDKEGKIVQGAEDDIKQMYYYMALQQEHDEELNIMKWKIAEMQVVGEMNTW